MIKRKLFSELCAHLEKKEITLIVGPRQAGKTTLMMLLRQQLQKQDKKTILLNLDIETDRQCFISQELLIKKIRLEFGNNPGYVFIDEIQRKENAGLFLKGIYDMNLPYKFIVSGSGNLELKEKIHESLAGRKRVFVLHTVSFEEFVNYKTNYKYEENLEQFFEIEKEKSRQFLEEYLQFGGYPKVILEDQINEKSAVINEIYQSYLERDIAYLLNVQKTSEFGSLLKVLAAQNGSIVNISELSRTLGIAKQTINNYLWYLEKTFIIQRVTPYFKNIRKEITKAPIFYFFDLGMRNHTLGIFANPIHEKGFLFQNFVYQQIVGNLENSAAKINFWRTKAGAEVDFVIESGQKIIALEVKYKSLNNPEITSSIRSFICKYNPEKMIIVNLTLEKTVEAGETKIFFVPFWKF